MSQQEPTLVAVIKAYMNLIYSFTDLFFKPLENFFKPYSESLSETTRILSSVFANVLGLMPIFLASIALGVSLFEPDLTFTQLENIDWKQLISVLMIFSSIVILALMQIENEDLSHSIYVFILLVTGGIFVSYFSTPSLYVVLFGIMYGIGGYISSYIDYENPLPHGHIYDNLEPHSRISKLSILFGIATILIHVIGSYLKMQGFNQFIVLSLGALIPAIAFASTSMQVPSYEKFYKHASLESSSPPWILTPRLLIILSVALSVSNGEIGILSLILFLSPSIFGIIFTSYIVGQTDSVLGQTTFKHSEMYSDPIKITGNHTADIDANVDSSNKTSELTVNLELEISEDIPDKNFNPWFNNVAVSNNVQNILQNLDRVDEEKIEQIKKFKRDSLEVAIDKYSDSGTPWSRMPESVRKETVVMKAENGDISLQKIVDLDIKYGRDQDKKPTQQYSDSM